MFGQHRHQTHACRQVVSRVLWFVPAVVGAGALILHLRRHRHIHRPRRMKSHPERLPLPLRCGDLGPRTEVAVGRARVVRDARLAAEVQPGAALPADAFESVQ